MQTAIEKLKQAGVTLRAYTQGNYKTVCPKCSHTRKNKKDQCVSVKIEHDSAVTHCHRCDWAEGFHDDREDRDYHPPRPIKSAPPKPKVEKKTVLGPGAQSWFRKRGITPETLEKAGVYETKHWIPAEDAEVDCVAFPYFRDGELINVKYRSGKKNFALEKGCEKIFYGADTAKDKTSLIIVEGEIDALSMIEAEIDTMYGILSVPTGAPKKAKDDPINPEEDTNFEYVWNCRELIESADKVILATDADGPGQALEAELSRRIGKEKCYRVQWPTVNDAPRKDANEVLSQDGAEVLRECVAQAQPYPIKSLLTAGHFESDVLKLFHGGRDRGMSTGWPELDKYLTIVTGMVSVVTGYPQSGKSEFIDALTVNLSMLHGWKIAVCSFENPPDEHIAKLAEKYVGAPFWEGFGAPRMGEGDLRRAMSWIDERFNFIRADDDTSPTIDWVLETAKAAVMRYGIRGLVLDPYNEFDHQRPAGMTETEYISQILAKIRRFALAHDLHVWFVAHPTKPMKDKQTEPPGLYDISGSANWANKVDVGIVVHRAWNADGSRPTTAEIHVKKIRFRWFGKVGMMELKFNPRTGRYEEVAA